MEKKKNKVEPNIKEKCLTFCPNFLSDILEEINLKNTKKDPRGRGDPRWLDVFFSGVYYFIVRVIYLYYFIMIFILFYYIES